MKCLYFAILFISIYSNCLIRAHFDEIKYKALRTLQPLIFESHVIHSNTKPTNDLFQNLHQSNNNNNNNNNNEQNYYEINYDEIPISIIEDDDRYLFYNNPQQQQHLENDTLFRRTNEINNIRNGDTHANKLKLYVEILVCTDYSIYKLHKSILSNYLHDDNDDKQLIVNHIKAYYTQIIQDVNRRYEMSFKNDEHLSISVNISGFYIATAPEESEWSEAPDHFIGYNQDNIRIINAHKSLIDFNSWLETNRQFFPNFDHVFGVTAYDIRNSIKNVHNDYNGLGYISGLCRKQYSGSLIEEKGGYTSARSFAHELGHSLGAEHDSDSAECSDWENYLMSSKFHSYNRNNSWVFSECSKRMIKKFLMVTENHLCLLNKPFPNYEFEMHTKLYPGQIYNSVEQCKQLFGPQSLPCYEFKSNICETLYCRKSSIDPECHWVAPAAEGTSCGNRKWCKLGKCVSDAQAPNSDCITDTTIWLDNHSKTNKISYKCKEGIEIISRNEGKTKKDVCNDLYDICCETCNGGNFLIELNNKNKESDDNAKETASECKDDLNNTVCDIAYKNDFCDNNFFWNGKRFDEWCKKKCNKCNKYN